jgi:hypothetical protein
LGPDGLPRTKAQEDELNLLFATVFRTTAAKQVLSYLRAITIEMVGGPEITDAQLRHREGARYLVGIIEARIAKGMKYDIGEQHPAARRRSGRRAARAAGE